MAFIKTPVIEVVNTTGIFALDGGEWEVTNNIWLIGNEREVIVIDAAHDAQPIVDAIHDRHVRAIALTHGHNDHINAALALQDVTDAPVYMHPADLMLWHTVYPDAEPDRALAHGDVLRAGGAQLGVLHTPGHSPGCCCFHVVGAGADGNDVVFSGDTLFCGGPGATGRSHSDHDTIVASIRSTLFALPPTTVVHTGHGESTTIAAEAELLGR
jgi:glyoxylase-like metal-dependent hydrolase (beta-lactamase superfamily II)